MPLFLRILFMIGWLVSLSPGSLSAQPAPLTDKRRKALTLVLEAQQAYRNEDLGRAVALAEKATPLLDFGEEKHIWCMVLRMHLGSQSLSVETETNRQAPQHVVRAEPQFLRESTPENAKKLAYSYLWYSKEADSKGNSLFAVGWLSTAFCLVNRYDPVWQPVAQYKLFSGIEGLAKQILPQKEMVLTGDEKAVKNREREALYALFDQIGISTGRALLTQAARDANPRNWEEAYTKAVTLYGANSPEVAIMLKTISNLYQTYGDSKTAIEKLRTAISILQRKPEPDGPKLLACYMDMALLLLQAKQYDAVAEAIRQAYPLLISQNRLNMSMSISGRRKEVYALANNDMRSLLAFAACVGPHQEEPILREIAYDAMLHLNGLLLDDSRRMRVTLHQQLTRTNDPVLQQCYTDWLATREGFLNGIDAKREKLGEAVATAETRLLNALRPERNPPPNRTDLTWQQVQAQLDSTEAAVSFVRFGTVSGPDDRRFPFALPSTDTMRRASEWLYGAMVIRPGYKSPRLSVLGREQDLLALLNRAKTPNDLYSTSRGPGFKNSAYGDSLYRFVWKPIEAWVIGADSLYISTEGLISQLALAALPLPVATRAIPPRKRYLSNRHHLNYVFGMRQVAQGIQPLRLASPTSLALLGDIDYEQTTDGTTDHPTVPTYLQTVIAQRRLVPLKPLPATGLEVSGIASLLPHHSLLRKQNATEAKFRQLMATPPTLLHIATHGIYLPYQAGTDSTDALIYSDDALTRSALALSGANRLWRSRSPVGASHDGLLTAYEIADFNLSRTRLAVLSACETGLGDVGLFASSEGLLGLQRGFRLAGVEKMVVSLWAVDDERTRQFMNTFYTALKAGREVRAAFRQAQVALQQTEDTAHWAAFVLIE